MRQIQVRSPANRTANRLVLGLFPSFDEIGGVQTSGQIAWNAVCATEGTAGYLHSYRAAGVGASPLRGLARASAVLRTVCAPGPADLALIWHLDLLKLVPFLLRRPRRIAVYLHGVEAWRPQSRLISAQLPLVSSFLCNSHETWVRFQASNSQVECSSHAIVHLGTGSPIIGSTPTPLGPPAALMLSRLDRREDYKGHREMITAWPRVLEDIPNAQLWIAGGGDLLPDLRALTTSLPNGSVRFFGQVSNEARDRLLAHCRCVALPSRGEGFGLIYLEAMRFGRPCLVSTLDAGREVVNPPEAGLAVDPSNPEQIAVAIRSLLSGDAWPNWSRRARQRYESSFTARHFQERLVAALHLAT